MTKLLTKTTLQPLVLFSEDAVLSGLHGRFKGPQAIENFHSQQVFARWHANNRVTTVDRVVSVSDEVSSSGRWSEAVQSNGSKNVGGTPQLFRSDQVVARKHEDRCPRAPRPRYERRND